MEPGKYSLTLTAIDGTTFVDVPETVTVKGEVEYQVIDVADLVKSESEINAALEDTALKDVEEETTCVPRKHRGGISCWR